MKQDNIIVDFFHVKHYLANFQGSSPFHTHILYSNSYLYIMFTNNYVKINIKLSIYNIIYNFQLKYDTTYFTLYSGKSLFVEYRANNGVLKIMLQHLLLSVSLAL